MGEPAGAKSQGGVALPARAGLFPPDSLPETLLQLLTPGTEPGAPGPARSGGPLSLERRLGP